MSSSFARFGTYSDVHGDPSSAMITSDVVAWAMLIASPVFIFFGARLFKWVLAGLGFVVTAVALQVILMKVGVWQELSDPTAIVVLLLAGCAGAALLLGVWTAACFVVGGVAGVLLVNVIHQLVASHYGSGGEPGQIARIAVSVVVFVAVGMMTATAWKNALGRMLTSFVGAYMATAGLSHIGMRFGWWHDDSLCPIHGLFQSAQGFECGAPECYALLAMWAVLFVCGWYCQHQYQHWEADAPVPLRDERDDASVTAADEADVSPMPGAGEGHNSPPQHALNYPLPKAPAAAPATSISVVTGAADPARPVPTLAPAPGARTKRPLLPRAHGTHFHHPLQHPGGSGGNVLPSQQPPPQVDAQSYYQSGSGIGLSSGGGGDAIARPKPSRNHGRGASQSEADPLLSATHAYGLNDS